MSKFESIWKYRFIFLSNHRKFESLNKFEPTSKVDPIANKYNHNDM